MKKYIRNITGSRPCRNGTAGKFTKLIHRFAIVLPSVIHSPYPHPQGIPEFLPASIVKDGRRFPYTNVIEIYIFYNRYIVYNRVDSPEFCIRIENVVKYSSPGYYIIRIK